MAVVGAPSSFATRKKPRTPQELTQHNCVNLGCPRMAEAYSGSSRKTGAKSTSRRRSTGLQQRRRPSGLAARSRPDLPDRRSRAAYLASGRLVRVSGDLVPAVSGYHLYYPSPPAAVASIVTCGITLGYACDEDRRGAWKATCRLPQRVSCSRDDRMKNLAASRLGSLLFPRESHQSRPREVQVHLAN